MPLATWEQAFTGYTTIVLEENINGEWLHWPFTVKPNGLTPGYGIKHPSLTEYVYLILEWIKTNHQNYTPNASPNVQSNITAHTQSDDMDIIKTLVNSIIPPSDKFFSNAGEMLLEAALILAKNADYTPLKSVLDKLSGWLSLVSKDLLMTDTELRRYYILADLGVVTIRGMIDDDVITQGFNVINKHDYRNWLILHGATDITANSAIVQGVYGLVFGGNKQYTFEAGSALRGLLRLGLTFKGNVYYRMLAGMGDAIFGPMYEVLQSRGVNFQFFHKITNLGLSADKKSIATITMDVQATLKPAYPVYNPLVTVNNLPCWPTTPNYEQLVEGSELQSQNVNLESYYSTWKPVVSGKVLNAGADFDEVVLGISIGALPIITKEFDDAAWKAMLKNVIPISTNAFQLWLKSSIEQMQWPYANDGLGLVGSYQEPYDTWSDMSDLIGREAWPNGYVPQNIAYFCGPTPQPYANQILQNAQTGNFSDPNFPAAQTQIAKDNAASYLQNLTKNIWPGLWKQGQTTFDFSQLIDLNNGTGPARFDAQFFRANIDPTELYVMSFTNSSQYRIKANGTAYSNLIITGDWTDNGFNAGCIEATVMSGLQAARAVSGVYFDIPGENDK